MADANNETTTALSTVPVQIKPLEWKQVGEYLKANGVYGEQAYVIFTGWGATDKQIEEMKTAHQRHHESVVLAALSAIQPAQVEPDGMPIGAYVRKKSGSWWEGRIVGHYSTDQTPNGVCVQIDKPNGPVQIYPASAMEILAASPTPPADLNAPPAQVEPFGWLSHGIFTKDPEIVRAWREGGRPVLPLYARPTPPADLKAENERLKMEALAHAMEARTANSTISEIYQVLSGGTGEPGNWNGADPARAYATAAEAREKTLREALEKIRNTGQSAEPDHWKFRCLARDIADTALKGGE